MALPKNRRNGVIAVAVVLVSLYRFISPYLDETKEMQGELGKVRAEIAQVHNEGAMFAQGWEKKMDEKERHLLEELPDSLNANGMLDYFLTRFEQSHPGSVVFLSVTRQNASATEFKVGTGNTASRARAVRYKINAQMAQDRVIPYIDHIEKFPGLFRVEHFDFTTVPGGKLEMELVLEFYLAPEEWSLPGKLLAKKKGGEEKPEELDWHPIFLMKPAGGDPAKRKIATLGTYRKPPVPTQVVGKSVVVDEGIYEEGDKVQGWTILEVNAKRRTVVFGRGTQTHRVELK